MKNDYIEKLEKNLKKYKRVILVNDESVYSEISEFVLNQDVLLISQDNNEYNDYMNMHLLYEFSNKISVISGNVNYANLINYLKSEIVSLEEFVNAITC